MKKHEANWLRTSATTGAQCALERYERMKAQADVALSESTAAHAFYVVIEGLSRDWARDPNAQRKNGPVSRWYLLREGKAFWPVELTDVEPDAADQLASQLRPMDDCGRHPCGRCRDMAYVVRNERDLGAAPSFDSCVEYSKHILCVRCRTVTRVPHTEEHSLKETFGT